MAENNTSFTSKLKRLFSGGSVVRVVNRDGSIRVIDTDNSQLLPKSSLRQRYASVYKTQWSNAREHGSLFHTTRQQLFRDYENMDMDPIIASAIDLYSEESALHNEFGEIIRINSSNDDIKQILNNLFYDVLNVNFNLAAWIRNLCKYGDHFLKLSIKEGIGIVDVTPISVYEIIREEGFDLENPNDVRFIHDLTGTTSPTANSGDVYQNYEVAHFRLLTDSNFLPYGKSILENVRRVWKQLKLMEDAMMVHRIVRAPERRVYKVDVGNIPPQDVEAYMQKLMQKTKKAPMLDQNTGEYNLKFNIQNLMEDFYLPVRGSDSGTSIDNLPGLDFQTTEDIEYLQKKLFAGLKIPRAFLGYEEDTCVSPDTLIPLLSGETKAVSELIDDYNNGVKNYVYSIDEKTGKVVPGEIEWAGYTREDAEVVKVWLDNDKYITCTPDHNFLTRDGKWVEASKLREGQSLMPLYLGRSTKKTVRDYTTVYHPSTGKYEMVHRLVSKHYNIKENGKIIHHIDFNKWNNNPENLDGSMTFMEHREFHIEQARLGNESYAMELYRSSDEFIDNCRAAGKLGGRISGKKLGEWVKKNGPSNKGDRSGSYTICQNEGCNAEVYYTLRPRKYCSKDCCNADWGSDRYNTKYTKISVDDMRGIAPKCSSFKELERELGVSRRTLDRIFYDNNVSKVDFIVKYMPLALDNTRFIKNFNIQNHKVHRVEGLSEKIDTCDLRISKYHNFGTDAGVIIHNSGKSTLAAEDMRFARSVEKVQRIVISELTKIAVIHLYANGYTDSDLVNFSLELTQSSTIYEQEKIRIWQEKIRLADDIKGSKMLSMEWIYENILNLSKADIAQEMLRIVENTKFLYRLEQIEQQGNDPAKSGQDVRDGQIVDPYNPVEGGEGTNSDSDKDGGDFGFSDETEIADVDFDDEKFKQGGRPRGNQTKYATDKHVLGRDPIGKSAMSLNEVRRMVSKMGDGMSLMDDSNIIDEV